MMSSVKVGKSKKMCAVKKEKKKKKLETCSLDVENVEMEMCLEVRKERKTLEMTWTQFVNMSESEGVAPSFNNQSFHQCCEGFTQLGPKTPLQHDKAMSKSVSLDLFPGFDVLQMSVDSCSVLLYSTTPCKYFLGTAFSLFH